MNARRHVLFAYVDEVGDGDDAKLLLRLFEGFVSSRQWTCGDAWAVNGSKNPRSATIEREIGLNLELPDTGSEVKGWFADVEEIAVFCRSLASQTGLRFVIGIRDMESEFSEELFWIDSGPIDIEKLASIFGTDHK